MNKETDFNVQDLMPTKHHDASTTGDKTLKRKAKEELYKDFESAFFEPALQKVGKDTSEQASGVDKEQELRSQIRQELESEYKQRLEELETENERLQTELAAKNDEEPTVSTARRISSKQRKLSLEEYRVTYLQVPHIDNRKPLFVSGELRDKLDRIVFWLAGERRMSASGMVENMVRQHLDIYADDINQWRRLGDI